MTQRRLCLVLLALLLTVAGVVYAQSRTYESITVAASSIGLSATTTDPTVGGGAGPVTGCQARLETAEIRYRLDGTAPTSSEGMVVEPGDVIDIRTYLDAKQIRFIRTGGTSGVLKVSCWQ
jgi:hypothetical protein